jgi:ABC-type Fe3+-hydroxamate transport system substrate-binding protein
MNAKILSVISILILFSGMSAVILGSVSDGADPTTATSDISGYEDDVEPARYIATLGYAPTLTVAMLGEIDKIVAVTTYSTYEYTKDERLKDLNAADLGSIYSANNNDYVVTWFLQWTDENDVDLSDVAIILTGYPNAITLGNELKKVGFEKVLAYNIITEYSDIVDCVREISILATGEVSSIVDDMELVKATIDVGLGGISEKAKGLAVWYSTASGEFQVNNTGSISTSLIEAAGGINIGYDPSVTGQRYGNISTVVQLIEANPDVVIFLSDTYFDSHTIGDFRETVLGGNEDIPILRMIPYWNNYDPDAAEGLWAFACALYPDLFKGEAPHYDDGTTKSNILLYAAAGFVVVIIIAGVAYFFMRKP